MNPLEPFTVKRREELRDRLADLNVIAVVEPTFTAAPTMPVSCADLVKLLDRLATAEREERRQDLEGQRTSIMLDKVRELVSLDEDDEDEVGPASTDFEIGDRVRIARGGPDHMIGLTGTVTALTIAGFYTFRLDFGGAWIGRLAEDLERDEEEPVATCEAETFFGFNARPRRCELPDGHRVDHLSTFPDGAELRWSFTPTEAAPTIGDEFARMEREAKAAKAERCGAQRITDHGVRVCDDLDGHGGAHTDGAEAWCDCKRGEKCARHGNAWGGH